MISEKHKMREDWDYVTMENYSADMAEHTARASGIIAELRRRAETAERALAEVVLAAGGEVTVPDEYLYDRERRVTLEVWRNECKRTVGFHALRASGQQ